MWRSAQRNVAIADLTFARRTLARGGGPSMVAQPDEQVVLALWCRLTGTELASLDEAAREAFLARPQVPALAATPYPMLLDAGVAAARRGSLPLERWLAAVRVDQAAAS
jgi:hypothetical protein